MTDAKKLKIMYITSAVLVLMAIYASIQTERKELLRRISQMESQKTEAPSDLKTIKGFITAEEKRLFDEIVDRLGMKQQAVISRLALWLLDQPPDVQWDILHSRLPK